jgi:hypothetical protein
LYIEEKMKACKHCPSPRKLVHPGNLVTVGVPKVYYEPNFVEEKKTTMILKSKNLLIYLAKRIVIIGAKSA